MKNKTVYAAALGLFALTAILITTKVIYGGQTVDRGYNVHLWRVNVNMNIKGKGSRAKVRLTLPRDNPHQTIYNEHFENNELVFYIRERALTGNRVGFWRAELLDGTKNIRYTFSAQLREVKYQIPPNLRLSTATVYPPEMKVWLDPSEFIQSQDPKIRQTMKKIIGRDKRVTAVMRKIFDYTRGQVKYRSERGSKDAKATLDKLTADCGGKARLFAALSRAAGIPSRLVGGIIMTEGMKNITHVWVENYIGGQWVPFDTVNDYYAMVPSHYLEIYRGDYSLIKHVGLTDFGYFFFVSPENFPPLDNPWSLYVLPTHFQSMAKHLLLIPIGALIVAFFRTIVGLPTFGTFTPILLSLAFQEVSLSVGLPCLIGIITCGWLLRKVLDSMKILVIPRLSVVVTMVVMAVIVIMVTGFHFGYQKMMFVSLFPMIIMTWMVERFSVLEIEDGTATALKTALGSAVVSIATYFVFGLLPIRKYIFAFPEILFAVMGLQLLMGRYTGLRLTELWRFRELLKKKKNLQP